MVDVTGERRGVKRGGRRFDFFCFRQNFSSCSFPKPMFSSKKLPKLPFSRKIAKRRCCGSMVLLLAQEAISRDSLRA